MNKPGTVPQHPMAKTDYGICTFCKGRVQLVYKNGNTNGPLVIAQHHILSKRMEGTAIPCPGSGIAAMVSVGS